MKKIIILIWLIAIAFTTNAQRTLVIQNNIAKMVYGLTDTIWSVAIKTIVRDTSGANHKYTISADGSVKEFYRSSLSAMIVNGATVVITNNSINNALLANQKVWDAGAAGATLSDSIVLRKTLDSIHKVIDTLIGIRKVIEKVRIIDSVKLSYAVELKDSLIITNNLLRDKALLSEINEKLDLLNQQVTQLDILAELGFINTNQLTQTDLLELINNKIIATVLTPGTFSSSGTGSVAAGARFISFANVGAANGTVNGVPLFAGETWTFPIVLSATYPAISFNATGTIFHIISIQ